MDYLKPAEIYPIIMASWQRARKNKVSSKLKKPTEKVSKNKLEQLLKTNHNLIQLFKSSIDVIAAIFQNEYLFILTDPQLILLDYSRSNQQMINFFEKGMIFRDLYLGTNAISLAQELKKPVYLTPESHYSDIFREWYCFAMPLLIDTKIIGFIDVSAVNKELKDEMIGVIKLLSELIIHKMKTYRCSREKDNINLTTKQRTILKYFVEGYTEVAVSLEMGISINTVKYHKKNLFRALKVNSTPSAIIKAVKTGILDIEEIDV